MKKKLTSTSPMKLLKDNSTFLLVLTIAFAYIALSVSLYGGGMSRQVANMLIPVSVYIVLAVSLNLVVGLLGELSLGHGGFMSAGLFSGCLLSIALNDFLPMAVRLPLSMLFGGLFATLIGFVVGLPALRLKGDYLAIVTLACCEIIKNVITNLNITGGALGLNTRPIYSTAKVLLPYAAALVLITVAVVMNLKKSKHGRAIMAIRDNRIAAESVGINVTRFKLTVFMIAAFFAGAAGTLYGHFFANVKAASFDYNMSIEVLVIVVLGGMGNVPGSIVAAIVLQALPEAMREFSDYRMLLYAIVLILVMLVTNNPKLKEFSSRLRPSVLLRKRSNEKKEEVE